MSMLAKIADRFPWLTVKLESFSDEDCSCTRKVRYGHCESADRAAGVMEKKLDRRMVAYPCRYCDGWHVGSR